MFDWIAPGTVCKTPPNCGFADLINLARVLINDLIFLATFLVVAGCIFIGFKLMTSGGNESAMKDAKDRLGSLLKGYFFLLAGWLIVYTITSTLINANFSFLNGLK